MNRLLHKTALITGASRGIGRACAQLFSKEGASVILTDIRQDEGEQLARELGGVFYPQDVSSETDWQRVMRDIAHLDILINNAGITGLNEHLGPQDPEHLSLSDWQYVHRINLDSIFLGCKYAISKMKAHGGSIVNLSSRSGMVGVPRAAAYASSKAAIRNHTKSVALYCAQQGYHIRCNSVHPGAVLTPIWDSALGEDARENRIAQMAAHIPLGTMGEPMDVAHALVFLASDESKYITGAELVIDGGILAGSSAEVK